MDRSKFTKLNERSILNDVVLCKFNQSDNVAFTNGKIYTANIHNIDNNETIVKIVDNNQVLQSFTNEEFEKFFTKLN